MTINEIDKRIAFCKRVIRLMHLNIQEEIMVERSRACLEEEQDMITRLQREKKKMQLFSCEETPHEISRTSEKVD